MSGNREIVFDTETTGFDARGDDRITEIGCVEIIDFLPTGKHFHAYINPRRSVPEKVTEITGLTQEFLIDNGIFFEDAAQGFLDFIGDSQLVAHNADFDRGFVNAELDRAGFSEMASRNKHGAIIDSESLAEVHLQLNGGRARSLGLDIANVNDVKPDSALTPISKPRPILLEPLMTDFEKAAHQEFIASLGDDMIWQKYWRRAEQQS